jgi:hypothetical protein
MMRATSCTDPAAASISAPQLGRQQMASAENVLSPRNRMHIRGHPVADPRHDARHLLHDPAAASISASGRGRDSLDLGFQSLGSKSRTSLGV